MAWTQEDYETLKLAVASGVQTVRYADKTITYHGLDEMRALLAEMNRMLTPDQVTSRKAAVRKFV